MFCAAPVLRRSWSSQEQVVGEDTEEDIGVPQSRSVDFWAVGVDCCDAEGASFHCGDSRQPTARAGLRVLDGNERAMYTLAVEQWSANTGKPVQHPLFFYWVEDP